MDALIVFCAKYLVAFIGLGALTLLYVRARWRGIAFLVGTTALSLIAGKLAGLVWYDPLPFVVNGTQPLFEHAANNGFPSDHTLLAAAAAWSVFLYSRTWGALLIFLALVVGGARMLAGVHHLPDVAAAVLIAGLCAYIARLSMERIASSRVQQ